jgi:nicotinamidase-related amidase
MNALSYFKSNTTINPKGKRMQRRTFLESLTIAGTSLLSPRLFSNPATGSEIAPEKQPDSNSGRILKLKSDYYRHYPVDFSQGTQGAQGFKGWGNSLEIEVAAEETALVPMHIWNIGFHPQLPFSPQGNAGPIMEMLEWASRSVPIIQTIIPPILKAARAAKIPIIHVASDEPYAKKYPGYQRTLEIAGAEPAGLPKAPRFDEIKSPDDQRTGLLFGEKYMQALPHYMPYIDFPDQARPLDSEYVVFTTHQFNEVLRKQGIWNLIYIGFAINWCLWFSPGGMVDMSRLGYRCSCIKEAVTAVENKESVVGEQHKEEALWRTSLMFGYIHRADDFIGACEKVKILF